MKLLPLALTVLLIGTALNVSAQQQQPFSKSEAGKKPLWIAMMDDTTANYFQVEQAFKLYFKRHELPEEEHDVIGEYAEREKKHFSRRALRRIGREETLSMDVKRYYRWREQTLPYVQADGRIMTPSERLAIWRSQRESQR